MLSSDERDALKKAFAQMMDALEKENEEAARSLDESPETIDVTFSSRGIFVVW